MKKIRMCFLNEKTFREGFEEYILDCKARNLRDGTINHYQESIKKIYKRITPDTLISSMCQQTMANFYISLRDDPRLLMSRSWANRASALLLAAGHMCTF